VALGTLTVGPDGRRFGRSGSLAGRRRRHRWDSADVGVAGAEPFGGGVRVGGDELVPLSQPVAVLDVVPVPPVLAWYSLRRQRAPAGAGREVPHRTAGVDRPVRHPLAVVGVGYGVVAGGEHGHEGSPAVDVVG